LRHLPVNFNTLLHFGIIIAACGFMLSNSIKKLKYLRKKDKSQEKCQSINYLQEEKIHNIPKALP
jgi:hypothetical protein